MEALQFRALSNEVFELQNLGVLGVLGFRIQYLGSWDLGFRAFSNSCTVY